MRLWRFAAPLQIALADGISPSLTVSRETHVFIFWGAYVSRETSVCFFVCQRFT
jgi:hypothetical protein